MLMFILKNDIATLDIDVYESPLMLIVLPISILQENIRDLLKSWILSGGCWLILSPVGRGAGLGGRVPANTVATRRSARGACKVLVRSGLELVWIDPEVRAIIVSHMCLHTAGHIATGRGRSICTFSSTCAPM